MTTYKIVIPESESDANYADYEYMLGWFDVNGNWQQHLFTDWSNKIEYTNTVFNKNLKDRIGAVSKEINKIVTLTIDDCSLNDLKIYRSIFETEKLFRIFKDGTTEIVATNSNSMKFEQRGIRFSFSFDLIHAE